MFTRCTAPKTTDDQNIAIKILSFVAVLLLSRSISAHPRKASSSKKPTQKQEKAKKSKSPTLPPKLQSPIASDTHGKLLIATASAGIIKISALARLFPSGRSIFPNENSSMNISATIPPKKRDRLL